MHLPEVLFPPFPENCGGFLSLFCSFFLSFFLLLRKDVTPLKRFLIVRLPILIWYRVDSNICTLVLLVWCKDLKLGAIFRLSSFIQRYITDYSYIYTRCFDWFCSAFSTLWLYPRVCGQWNLFWLHNLLIDRQWIPILSTRLFKSEKEVFLVLFPSRLHSRSLRCKI